MNIIKDTQITPIKITNDRYINTIRLEVEYDKGGVALITNEKHERGIICRIKPIEKKDGFTYMLYDGNLDHQGFYVFCEHCQRKAPKRMKEIADKIFNHSDQIAKLFVDKNYQEIANIIVVATREIEIQEKIEPITKQ